MEMMMQDPSDSSLAPCPSDIWMSNCHLYIMERSLKEGGAEAEEQRLMTSLDSLVTNLYVNMFVMSVQVPRQCVLSHCPWSLCMPSV